MPPTSQRMEQDMTAEDMLRVMEKRIELIKLPRGLTMRTGDFVGSRIDGILIPDLQMLLRSDLLALLRELIALRAKPAAIDGDVEDDLDALHLLWTDAVLAMLQTIVPGATVDCSPRETDEETVGGIVGNVREIIVAQVESLRAANAKTEAAQPTEKLVEVSVWVGATKGSVMVPENDAVHVCGSHGFGQGADDRCPACEAMNRARDTALAPPSPAPDAEGKR